MFGRFRRIFGLAHRRKVAQPQPAIAPAPVKDENFIFLSDLHLGEACKNVTRVEYLKAASSYDRHITSFLEHYAQHRSKDRPWRLILGGDLLDFLQVTMPPSDADEAAVRFGLGSREDESRWKLERLFERHRSVFLHLGDFIGRGNRVEIIRGNHDEEFFWPSVQERFRELLEGLYFGDEAGAGCTKEAFQDSIRFHPWFFYLPGLLYAEHGHRFDEYCSTPPQLCPLRPQAEDQLVQPLSAVAIKYFANLEVGFDTHDKEHWGLADYIKYFRGNGVAHGFGLFTRYLHFAKKSVLYHLEHGRFVSEAAVAAHEGALDEMAEAHGVDGALIREIDNLAPPNIMTNFVGVCANVCIGEVAAVLVSLITLIVTLASPVSWATGMILVTGVGFLSFSGALLNRRRFDRNVRAKLDRAADKISRLLNVPVVCFGHSHAARLQRLPHNHRHYYVNSGSFLRPHGDEHAPDEACTCRQTFIVLETPAEYAYPSPKLMRWCAVTSSAYPAQPRT